MKIYTFSDAVKYCYLDVMKYRYCNFRGRSGRQEYWLFVILMSIPMTLLYVGAIFGMFIDIYWDNHFNVYEAGLYEEPSFASGFPIVFSIFIGLMILWNLAHFIPSLAVTIRRLHDTGRSGWYFLIAFIPIIGALIFMVYMCLSSQPMDNRYGPNPNDG